MADITPESSTAGQQISSGMRNFNNSVVSLGGLIPVDHAYDRLVGLVKASFTGQTVHDAVASEIARTDADTKAAPTAASLGKGTAMAVPLAAGGVVAMGGRIAAGAVATISGDAAETGGTAIASASKGIVPEVIPPASLPVQASTALARVGGASVAAADDATITVTWEQAAVAATTIALGVAAAVTPNGLSQINIVGPAAAAAAAAAVPVAPAPSVPAAPAPAAVTPAAPAAAPPKDDHAKKKNPSDPTHAAQREKVLNAVAAAAEKGDYPEANRLLQEGQKQGAIGPKDFKRKSEMLHDMQELHDSKLEMGKLAEKMHGLSGAGVVGPTVAHRPPRPPVPEAIPNGNAVPVGGKIEVKPLAPPSSGTQPPAAAAGGGKPTQLTAPGAARPGAAPPGFH